MDALFGVARKLVGPWVQEQVSKGAIEQLAEASKKSAVKKENAYEAFVTDSKKGIILTWVENQINTKLPGFLDTVLDKYRGQLYKVLTQSGENQNILFPQLGKAGTLYAKSVPNVKVIHGSQPDPGDLFDLLLGRDDTNEEDIRESNLGISSMLLYHATIIIHDIFRTNVADKNISDTSSYLDFSPLYGKDAANQKTVREFQRGLLKPDTFAEERLLNQPVGVCIYLIMYNRFHNYVTQQLLEINENGKFYEPPEKEPNGWKPNANWQPPKRSSEWSQDSSPTDWPTYQAKLAKSAEVSGEARQKMYNLWRDAAKEKLDEDLFQTARLITCGMYINISIHDYLRVLTRAHLKDTPWTLDPRKEIPLTGLDPRGVPRGQGNQVSVEFNVLYRFHTPLSRRDVKWTSQLLKDILQDSVKPKKAQAPSDSPSLTQEELENYDIPIPVMGIALKEMYLRLPTLKEKMTAPAFPEGLDEVITHPRPPRDAPRKYRYKRDPVTHRFDDRQLVEEMVRVIEDPTCEFGAKNTARMFRSIEILGILQARKWELASLNEFRKFFGLSVHKTFEDMNKDEKIVAKLKSISRHVDQVELYPGLVCEGDGQCLDPGTKNTALWGAVFSDAVTLVRSDRFYTTDWNVGSLTGWGLREVTSNPEVMKGLVMHRLFQRAFPGFFPYNSLHLWQPFHIPAMNYVLAKSQGVSADLETLAEMGLNENTIKAIHQLLSSQSDVTAFYESNIKSGNPSGTKQLKTLVEGHEVGYTALEKTQIREIWEMKEAVSKDSKMQDKVKQLLEFAAIQMAFKPLKRAIRIPDSKFEVRKAKAMALCVSSYDTIAMKILAEAQLHIYKNPGYLDLQSIPEGPLRAVLSGNPEPSLGAKMRSAMSRIRAMVDQQKEDLFMRYFSEKASYYLGKERREYQISSNASIPSKNAQTYQVDVISDVAIPSVAQFVADFLGFWDFSESANPDFAKTVYWHLSNCQDYLTYNSDKLSVFPRRIEFRKSITWLNDVSVFGVKQVTGKKRGIQKSKNVSQDVWELRVFGSEMIRELVKLKQDSSQKAEDVERDATAILLSIVLDAVHKSVLMFTEVLNYLLHAKDRLWSKVKDLSSSNSDQKLIGYVLEAQRLAIDVPLVRQVTEDVKIQTSDDSEAVPIGKGQVLMIDLVAAQKNAIHFESPETFNPNRKSEEYLLYGRKPDEAFTAKHLTIIAVTAMIKQTAKLDCLRRAHNVEGRINTVKTPDGVKRYLTQEFDELVPFPTTWQLRFNGEGDGVYGGPDNSDAGDGMENVYQDGRLSDRGGTLSKA